MFDRKKYKSFARIQLKRRGTVPALMTLITVLVVLLLSLPLIKLWLAMYSELLNAAAAQSSRYVLQKIISNYQKEIERIAFLPWLVFFTIAVCAIAQFCVYLKMSRGPEPVSFGDFFADVERLHYRYVREFRNDKKGLRIGYCFDDTGNDKEEHP